MFRFEELKKVSVDDAKLLIILDEENKFSDNIKIRTLLAIKKYFSSNIPIIIELRDEITLGLINRISKDNTTQTVIGGAEMYQPLCRFCYNKLN